MEAIFTIVQNMDSNLLTKMHLHLFKNIERVVRNNCVFTGNTDANNEQMNDLPIKRSFENFENLHPK